MNDQKGPTASNASRMPSRREALAGPGAVGFMLMNAGSVLARSADGANPISLPGESVPETV